MGLRMLLPKGRLLPEVRGLLDRCGLITSGGGRDYRPGCSDPEVEVKLLKPQNIPRLVELGRHDCGFTGHDWVVETGADVIELLDLGLSPARLVAAVPEGRKCGGETVVASEYRRITEEYMRDRGIRGTFVRSWGATEALPPEDADMVVDICSTGATLRANRLRVVDCILHSTTRFICSREAHADRERRRRLDRLVMLLESLLEARSRRVLEMNVPREAVDRIADTLPCMRAPTVSPLHGEAGFAVKVAVPADAVPGLVPRLKSMGARDILEYAVERILP
jgi:ATP phosphoribosyltransferase